MKRPLVLIAAVLVDRMRDHGGEHGEADSNRHDAALQPRRRRSRRSPLRRRDPADFPKMASHLHAFGDGSTNAHFALNVIRGCNPTVADKSHSINPKQVNFIVPA